LKMAYPPFLGCIQSPDSLVKGAVHFLTQVLVHFS
jgi:hypothetical protein